jgi:predicted acylesterase/phospholipase RssA/CRP-like cAMP-binding protein
LLRGLPTAVLEDIDRAVESVRVPGGAVVVRRGQTRVPMILIVRGGLRASFVDEQGLHVVFECFRGATVGEGLMLSGAPSPLDLQAIRDTELVLLSPEQFDRLATRHPQLALALARRLTHRLIERLGSHDVLTAFARKTDRLPRSIALATVGGEAVARMRDLLEDALSRSCRTARLTEESAERAESDGGLSAWVDRLDSSTQLVSLECGGGNLKWLDYCVRQADRIMVLVDEAEIASLAGPAGSWGRERLGERPAHVQIAVVHGRATDMPRGGAICAGLPGVVHVHHVRAGEPRDAERLARWLLDRPVGLVLGGGGARGIAHVGIIKALEDAGVPVDIVGGSSMGAIFAGGLARGWSADRMTTEVAALFSSRFALYDPTIPRVSLLRGKKLDRVMERYYGELEILDLWTPFFCVATNMSLATAHIHERGKLRDAVRSSCSIPGLFPPLRRDGNLLVDGGLVDNLPISFMSERCRGPIIAADVSGLHHREEEAPPDGAEGLPGLFEILARATFVGSRQTMAASLARRPPALYLRPAVEKFKMLDWGRYEALIEVGYEAAWRALSAGALPPSRWAGPLEASASG